VTNSFIHRLYISARYKHIVWKSDWVSQ